MEPPFHRKNVRPEAIHLPSEYLEVNQLFAQAIETAVSNSKPIAIMRDKIWDGVVHVVIAKASLVPR